MPERVSEAPEPSENRPMSTIEKSLLEAEVVEQLRTVYDPEIPVNVYDLGLIYDIVVKDDRSVAILMTLTSPNCPVAGTLPGEIQMAAATTPGVTHASVELTWDPPFTIEMMSEDAKLLLGLS
jgi:FeS assembly SUF system protein